MVQVCLFLFLYFYDSSLIATISLPAQPGEIDSDLIRLTIERLEGLKPVDSKVGFRVFIRLIY